MGYTIRIGQAVVAPDDGGEALTVEVQKERHPEAPVFPGDEMTGNSNARRPSYAGWADFCGETGLRELFFNEERGLMREHPGCFRITAKHLEAVQHALAAWRARYPMAVPRFAEIPSNETVAWSTIEAHLARLIWLEWWMRYALKTHSLPAIYNS